ncbi:MAG: DNA cytosine methyltransferase [Proteobacteria bacterium]|nr:DNA cytosine methyltransferase [Pseudomonadota bacterium]
MRPMGVDLFAGAGGMSLGFEQAGFDIVAAVEVDPVHCAVHKFNFPKCAVIPRSVVGLSAEAIRRAAGIGNRTIDVVFGGPPCQGFSLIGHRSLDDSRNRLVLEFVRLVAELDASQFVFENVKGLTVGKHRAFLEELIASFGAVGYKVRLAPQVLNAANFGVPQSRERLFLLGAKDGIPLPEYPGKQTSHPRTHAGFDGLPPGPTCEDALSDIPDADKFDELANSDEVFVAKWSRPSRYASEMRALSNDAWHYGYRRAWNPRVLTSSMRTIHSDISRSRFSETRPGNVEPISRFFKLSKSGISNTLRAGTDSARGAFTSPRPIHYDFDRCITVREMARLHGYPDWFRFHSTKWHGARQIGNSVPPPLARAVAEMAIRSLGITPNRPDDILSLGEPALLTMEMSSATIHFDVPRAIGNRDRKSGAKKRKQHEVEADRRAALALANG